MNPCREGKGLAAGPRPVLGCKEQYSMISGCLARSTHDAACCTSVLFGCTMQCNFERQHRQLTARWVSTCGWATNAAQFCSYFL